MNITNRQLHKYGEQLAGISNNFEIMELLFPQRFDQLKRAFHMPNQALTRAIERINTKYFITDNGKIKMEFEKNKKRKWYEFFAASKNNNPKQPRAMLVEGKTFADYEEEMSVLMDTVIEIRF